VSKEGEKKVGEDERESVYAINMKQLSSESTAYSMALILPLHPWPEVMLTTDWRWHCDRTRGAQKIDDHDAFEST